MSYFENELSRAIVLALFIPLIVSSGGNTGSQAATLIIRAMALGEVTINDWWRIMRRELLSGFVLGLILGVIGFIRVHGLVSSVSFLRSALADDCNNYRFCSDGSCYLGNGDGLHAAVSH